MNKNEQINKNQNRIIAFSIFAIAMMLTIIPFPEFIVHYMPDWGLMALIFLSINLPKEFNLSTAFFVGLITDVIKGAVIDGGEPTFEAIADGSYSISRALYFYVKHAHVDVVPGVRAYMKEWTKHWGEDGMLADAGMVPLPEDEMAEMEARITELPKLVKADLQ